jgi:hypothetical protein
MGILSLTPAFAGCLKESKMRLNENYEQERLQEKIEKLKNEIAGESRWVMTKLEDLIELVLEYHVNE